MTYLRNRPGKFSGSSTGDRYGRLGKIVAVIVVSLLIILLLEGFTSTSKTALTLSNPFLKAKESLKLRFSTFFTYIEDKEKIKEENRLLIRELERVKIETELNKILEIENAELKKILEYQKVRKGILASVLSRPPETPYDVLIIDIGSDDRVKKGMIVVASGDIFLGIVEEISSGTSRVKLSSSPGEETSVFISSLNIFTKALGVGGGNFKITLPRESDIKSGDIVMILGGNPLMLGTVEEIKRDPTEPFQEILLRTPINIQTLRWVEVLAP